MPSQDYDIIIVGGGIVGCVSAYQLAPDHNVVVVEKDQIASDATSRASGVLSTPSVYPEDPEIGKHAMDFFRKFDGTGIYSFTERKKIQPVPPEAKDDALIDAERKGVTFLDPKVAEARYSESFVNLSEYIGVLEYRDTGLTDPSDYALSLKHAAETQGAEFRTDTAVSEVLVEGGNVAGVQTEYGTLSANHVICGANWYSRDLLEGIVEVPVRPFRWNAIVFDVGQNVSHYPIGAETALEVYWRPTPNGHLLVGGGEHLIDDPSSAPKVTDSFEEKVTERLPHVLPSLEGADIIKKECCPSADSATPDTWPIIDAPNEGPNGLVVATGFQRGGIMTSPCTGTAVRSLITGEKCPFSLDHFTLDRLDTRSADFEFVSLYDIEI